MNMIVSASDDKYYPLLLGMILSILSRKQIKIGVIDLGMTNDQRSTLESMGVEVKEYGRGEPEVKPELRGMVCRPYLMHYFDADKYLWLDADCWVQDISAIDEWFAPDHDGYVGAAREQYYEPVSYVCEPGREKNIRYGYCQNHIREVVNKWFPDYQPFDGYKGLTSTVNSGVFCAAATSDIWSLWQDRLEQALKHEQHWFSEMAAFNVAFWSHMGCRVLDTRFNHLVNYGMPRWDNDKQRWVDPRGQVIGIMHLADTKWDNLGLKWDNRAPRILITDGYETGADPLADDSFRLFQTYHNDVSLKHCSSAPWIEHVNATQIPGDNQLADFRTILWANHVDVPKYVGFTGYRHKQKYLCANAPDPEETTPDLVARMLKQVNVGCWYWERNWKLSANLYHEGMVDIIVRWLAYDHGMDVAMKIFNIGDVAVPMGGGLVFDSYHLSRLSAWIHKFLAWAEFEYGYPSPDKVPIQVEAYGRIWAFIVERVIATYWLKEYGSNLLIMRMER